MPSAAQRSSLHPLAESGEQPLSSTRGHLMGWPPSRVSAVSERKKTDLLSSKQELREVYKRMAAACRGELQALQRGIEDTLSRIDKR